MLALRMLRECMLSELAARLCGCRRSRMARVACGLESGLLRSSPHNTDYAARPAAQAPSKGLRVVRALAVDRCAP